MKNILDDEVYSDFYIIIWQNFCSMWKAWSKTSTTDAI